MHKFKNLFKPSWGFKRIKPVVVTIPVLRVRISFKVYMLIPFFGIIVIAIAYYYV